MVRSEYPHTPRAHIGRTLGNAPKPVLGAFGALSATQGQHIGQLPACEWLRAEICKRNAEGYPTVMAGEYRRLVELGASRTPARETDEACDLKDGENFATKYARARETVEACDLA